MIATLIKKLNFVALNENQRLFFITIVIGFLCGLAAVSYHLTILFFESILIDRALVPGSSPWPIALIIIIPTLGGIIGGVFLAYVFPDARGSGIPQVKVAFSEENKTVTLRTVFGKYFVTAFQIGSGASLGREGPTVQICTGIAQFVGKRLGVTKNNIKKLIPVGAAAGIAAAFNAPLAAVTFTIEEIVGDVDQSVLSGVIVAAAIAGVVEHSILGGHPILEFTHSVYFESPISLISYGALGIIAAFVSIFFTDLLLLIRKKFSEAKSLPLWLQPGIGGLLTGVMIFIALEFFNITGINGGGYHSLSLALSGKLALQVLLISGVIKIFATVFSYSSGGAGGIFAPALFIGGMIGGTVGYLDMSLFSHSSSELGSFALVGMGAVFAGAIRAPITSILIIMEMTGSYELLIPLMLANIISYAIAKSIRPIPIYEALLEQDGILLPSTLAAQSKKLDTIHVEEVMNKRMVTLSASMTVNAAIEFISIYNESIYAVLNKDRLFVGFVKTDDLHWAEKQGHGTETLSKVQCTDCSIIVHAPLSQALFKMNSSSFNQIAVVASKEKPQLLGIINTSEIMEHIKHGSH